MNHQRSLRTINPRHIKFDLRLSLRAGLSEVRSSILTSFNLDLDLCAQDRLTTLLPHGDL